MTYMKRKILLVLTILIFWGILDSAYLTYEHYANFIPPCPTHPWLSLFIDCGRVLRSQYSLFFGIPVALIGLIHYSLFFTNTLLALLTRKKIFTYFIVVQSIVGTFASAYFMYVQFFIIGSICLYCTFSALISFIIFALAAIFLRREKKELMLFAFAFFYQNFLKPILFLIDPEFIHETMLATGYVVAKIPLAPRLISRLTRVKDKKLRQKIAGIEFENPVGLAAGFDYLAKMPFVSPTVGFGFQSIGTITNKAYEGNLKPRLGRLPKSKSLMVNKGFKNPGADEIARKLRYKKFQIPIGISIGKTNTTKINTQKDAIKDIVETFQKFERSKIKHSYYELNISCPNLFGKVTFYPSKNLKELLSTIEKLKIKKPIFIKMPIEKSDRETLEMLEVISKFTIKGLIIGNLQKNRRDPALVRSEVAKFHAGNFSGKPTFKRSNELIRLAYKKFGKKLIIIGCGGIFSAEDAYTKIKLGASLVQLITGIIFQGPQLIAQINYGLIELLEKDGFTHISEAVGSDV